MTIFNGTELAEQQEEKLRKKVATQSVKPHIAAILFTEDHGSRLYSQLKKEAAERVGIGYDLLPFSLKDPTDRVLETLATLATDSSITGIMIQKPTQRTWAASMGMEQGSEEKKAYTTWWQTLVSAIALEKDVDGLHPQTLEDIKNDTWIQKKRALPATCQAVLEILVEYCMSIKHEVKKTGSGYVGVLQPLENKKIIILGKSNLLGKPLYYILHNEKFDVEMIGSKELEQRVRDGINLTDADVIISATGRHHLIKGDMLKDGVAVIDVGEPKADVEFESVKGKASFITPVPGGVGPMTVYCLLANSFKLIFL